MTRGDGASARNRQASSMARGWGPDFSIPFRRAHGTLSTSRFSCRAGEPMPAESPSDQFRVERHGEIAVVFPSPKVEEMHEGLMDQAAKMVIASLKEDPPAGIV